MPRFPKIIHLALYWLAGLLLLQSAVRIGFWAWFAPADGLTSAEVGHGLLLGLRFDLRLSLLCLLPLLLLGGLRRLSPFASALARRAWLAYAGLVLTLLTLFAMFDFGHYSYLQLKLNASVLNFLQDLETSAGMVWSSYPVLRLLALLAAVAALLTWGAARLLQRAGRGPAFAGGKLPVTAWALLVFILTVLGVHGRFSQYPLRWSDAYFSTHPFAPALALNPVLNFFDTQSYAKSTLDIAAVRRAYPRMAAYLGVDHPDVAKLNFQRIAQPKANALPGQPNVVLVYLESFSGYKTSVFGNPLDTTPYFAQLAKQGILFDRFYTPHVGTARGVFAGLTGIPDAEMGDTSSRNPASVDQHSIINAFKGYEKLYFIGGSTTWANIRGLLSNNIDGIQIFEEGSYQSPRNDVWGVSDTNLFLEANQRLSKLQQTGKPFFAIIQTSGNHRPYTIPEEDKGFVVRNIGDKELHESGFFSSFEFNSFRYMDYSIQRFIEAAKQEPYFDNTVFAFFGDHGITGFAGGHMAKAYTDLKLSSVHTPFLLYAPKLLQPARRHQIASQIDVLPTVAGLFNRPYLNQSLGRDLLDPRFDAQRLAFIMYHGDGPELAIMDDQRYLKQTGFTGQPSLHAWQDSDARVDLAAKEPQRRAELAAWLRDYYWTARYMLVNNHKAAHPQ